MAVTVKQPMAAAAPVLVGCTAAGGRTGIMLPLVKTSAAAVLSALSGPVRLVNSHRLIRGMYNA
jgi:hypothetical protein